PGIRNPLADTRILDFRSGPQLAGLHPGPNRRKTVTLDTQFGAPRSMSVYHQLQQRQAEGRPIRVGVVGAGATGRAIALQLGTPVPGLRLAGVANRTPSHAERSLKEAGITNWQSAGSPSDASAKISRGLTVLTDDPSVLTRSDAI